MLNWFGRLYVSTSAHTDDILCNGEDIENKVLQWTLIPGKSLIVGELMLLLQEQYLPRGALTTTVERFGVFGYRMLHAFLGCMSSQLLEGGVKNGTV